MASATKSHSALAAKASAEAAPALSSDYTALSARWAARQEKLASAQKLLAEVADNWRQLKLLLDEETVWLKSSKDSSSTFSPA